MTDVLGPIELLILEYPRDTRGEASAQALAQLAERGVSGIPAAWAAFAGARSRRLGSSTWLSAHEVEGSLDVLEAVMGGAQRWQAEQPGSDRDVT